MITEIYATLISQTQVTLEPGTSSIQYSKVKWKVKEQLIHVWFQAFQKRIPPLSTQIELGFHLP